MSNRSIIHRDLLALTLLAGALFFALALATYDPADYPSTAVYPQNESPTNVCGQLGAYTAHLLLSLFGIGAYYTIASAGVLIAVLLARRPVAEPGLRAVGWLASFAGFISLVSVAIPSISPGPVIGSGGYVGAVAGTLLETHLAQAGSYILTLSLLVGGLLLCTDYVIFTISARLFGPPARRVAAGVGRLAPRRRVSTAATDVEDEDFDLDEEEEDEQAHQPLRVRIGGKTTSDDEEHAEEDADDEEEAEEEDSDTPQAKPRPVLKPKIRARLAQAITGKKPSKQSERSELRAEIEAATNEDNDFDFELPPIDLLEADAEFCHDEQNKEVRRKAKILERTFKSFGLNVKVVEIETGPVIAQFEVQLEAGLRLSRITGLADDLAIALRVPSVRIVAPIPGKNTVGIEVPNAERQLVRIRSVMQQSSSRINKMAVPIFLGKDVSGAPMTVDLASMPHLLIAGRTGTGKSVCLNSIIMSMIMTRAPDEVKLLLIDPKMVELSSYMRIPHLMHPVVTDMKKAEAILAWAVDKMEERYQLLARAGVRHLSVYNQLGEEELFRRLDPQTDEDRAAIPRHLPYIVIVADEMADLMMTAAKEVEAHIIRLAQKSRAVGIHLVLATQKPTVDVITGLIKSNLPARIAFQVASRTDSRVVLDEMGADKLLGNGDMLFLWPGTSTLMRGQGAYVSDDEISRAVDFVGTTKPQFVNELVNLPVAGEPEQRMDELKNRDELYESAIEIVVREGRGSVSLLQRSLGIGYGRAARLIDFMAEDGIVGDYNGSQAREVVITPEQWARREGFTPASSTGAPAAAAPATPAAPPAPALPAATAKTEKPPFDVGPVTEPNNRVVLHPRTTDEELYGDDLDADEEVEQDDDLDEQQQLDDEYAESDEDLFTEEDDEEITDEVDEDEEEYEEDELEDDEYEDDEYEDDDALDDESEEDEESDEEYEEAAEYDEEEEDAEEDEDDEYEEDELEDDEYEEEEHDEDEEDDEELEDDEEYEEAAEYDEEDDDEEEYEDDEYEEAAELDEEEEDDYEDEEEDELEEEDETQDEADEELTDDDHREDPAHRAPTRKKVVRVRRRKRI